MRWMDAARARLGLLFARRAAESRMNEEFRFHLEMETERLIREEGLSAIEARRRALVAFGGVDRYGEALRADRGFAWLSGLSLDLRLGLRMLVTYPGLAIIGGRAGRDTQRNPALSRRHLRDDVVHRGATSPRDRHPRRAGRAARATAARRLLPRGDATLRRRAGRPRARGRDRPRPRRWIHRTAGARSRADAHGRDARGSRSARRGLRIQPIEALRED
jgi:hypothetical protein